MPILPAIAAALLVVAPQDAPAPQSPAQPPAPILLDHAALSARLRALADEHSEVATCIPLGPSREGREILALRLAAGEPGPGRPAILVVANIDGPQVFSSALALWQVERLLERRAGDEAVRALLESTTVYVIPRAHPDAAEARFGTPLAEVEATGQGADVDRDGRRGEDPPADVDGDGVIAWMRVPDPEGDWIPDPAEARATIEADRSKGQRGRWRLVREGRDLDGDERAGEDAPADAVVNENFPSGWREHEPRAGLFPMDEPEARALADFVIGHRDVALVLTYGALDNLVEAPESVRESSEGGRRFGRGIPEPGWLESDAGRLAELARRRAELTGRKPRGARDGAGSFQTWVYDHRGLFSLAAALWEIPTEAPADSDARDDQPGEDDPADQERGGARADRERRSGRQRDGEPSDEAGRLAWCDASEETERFLPWKTFEHPELGPVEIGGWRPYARIEPPESEALEIARGELEFLVSLGAVLPRVELAEARARALADGLVEVEVALENAALLPLRSASARRTGTVRAARVELVLPEGATLVAGSRETLVGELDGAGGRRELRWLVAGEGIDSVGIVLDSDHAGAAQVELEVER